MKGHPRATAPWGKIISWALFDFANTGFYVVIITLVFQVYFIEELAGGNEALWGRTISASMLVTALIGPFLGSVADATNRKKLFLGLFTILCVGATIGLYGMTGPSLLAVAIGLLILANVGFEGGTIFYDAFLPELAAEKDVAKISGIGFAFGYAGSFLTLVAVLLILGDEPTGSTVRLTFLFAALFFGLFSLPVFLFVPERAKEGMQSMKGAFRQGYSRLRETFRHIRSYRDVARFLLAFFIYNDAILTVLLFAAIFMKDTLELTSEQQIKFFMVVQGTALVGSLLFGWITNRIGPRTTLLITLAIWIGVVVWAYFVQSAGEFFVVGGIAGLALGSSQSTSRAFMSLLTPREKETEFFGFYDGFFGKASAVVGPLIFGEISALAGIRPAMLVLGGMFALGGLLLLRVPDVRPENS